MCKPINAASETAAATPAAPESSAPTPSKQCSICKTTFPSRSALFKHLRSGACDARLAQAPTKANAILQIGYHSSTPDAVEAALRLGKVVLQMLHCLVGVAASEAVPFAAAAGLHIL